MSESSEQFEDQIADYMEGKLSPAEAARVEMLLNNGDPKVAALVRGMLEDRQYLREMPRPQAPGDLVERIMEHIERDSLLGTSIDHQLADERRRWFTSHMAIAAGLAIVIGGFLFFVISSSIQHVPDKGSREEQLDKMVLRTTETKSGAIAAVKTESSTLASNGAVAVVSGGMELTGAGKDSENSLLKGSNAPVTTTNTSGFVDASGKNGADKVEGTAAVSGEGGDRLALGEVAKHVPLRSASERVRIEMKQNTDLPVDGIPVGQSNVLRDSEEKNTLRFEKLGLKSSDLIAIKELANKNLMNFDRENNPVVVNFRPKDRAQYNELCATVNLLIGEHNRRHMQEVGGNGGSNYSQLQNNNSITLNQQPAQQQKLADNKSYVPVRALAIDGEKIDADQVRAGLPAATQSVRLTMRGSQIDMLLNRYPWESMSQKKLAVSSSSGVNMDDRHKYSRDNSLTANSSASTNAKDMESLEMPKSSKGVDISESMIPLVIEIVPPDEMLKPATAPAKP